MMFKKVKDVAPGTRILLADGSTYTVTDKKADASNDFRTGDGSWKNGVICANGYGHLVNFDPEMTVAAMESPATIRPPVSEPVFKFEKNHANDEHGLIAWLKQKWRMLK